MLDFKAAPLRQASSAFEAMNEAYLAQLDVIPPRKIIDQCISQAKISRAEVAFFNLFPYRTRDNTPPNPELFRLTAKVIARPLVKALNLCRVLLLGLGMGADCRGVH